jgi:hypothetical protein
MTSAPQGMGRATSTFAVVAVFCGVFFDVSFTHIVCVAAQALLAVDLAAIVALTREVLAFALWQGTRFIDSLGGAVVIDFNFATAAFDALVLDETSITALTKALQRRAVACFEERCNVTFFKSGLGLINTADRCVMVVLGLASFDQQLCKRTTVLTKIRRTLNALALRLRHTHAERNAKHGQRATQKLVAILGIGAALILKCAPDLHLLDAIVDGLSVCACEGESQSNEREASLRREFFHDHSRLKR